MHKRWPLCLAIAALLGTAGCGVSAEQSKSAATALSSSPAAKPLTETQPSTVAPSDTSAVTAKQQQVQQFLQQHELCRAVLSSKRLTDFLAENLTVTRDTRNSQGDLGYVAYRDTMFAYEFLDQQLFAVRYILPRTRESAETAMAPFQQALGLPTSTIVPPDLKAIDATQFWSWDLPEHNLRVKFAYLPPSFVESDLNLLGQFVNRKIADELAARVSKLPVTATGKP